VLPDMRIEQNSTRVAFVPCQRGISNISLTRSSNDRSSFSGLFTGVEIGHIVIGSVKKKFL
jgi:hypothetical protein